MPASNTKKPVYLRGIPSDVVREAKAIAARRGITLAGFVADTLARAVTGEPEDSAADTLSDEMRWYEKHRERLLRDYAGQYVAIVSHSVIDHDRDFEALAQRVFAEDGSRDVFMPFVGKKSQPLRVHSPRVGRRR